MSYIINRSDTKPNRGESPPKSRRLPPAILCKGLVLSVLSIHIDENGNLNLSNRQNPAYCFTMVFHNQDDDISAELQFLNKRLSDVNDLNDIGTSLTGSPAAYLIKYREI